MSERGPLTARKIVIVLLGLVVSVIFAWLTLRNVPIAELQQHVLGASLPILALTLVAKLVGMTFMSLRSVVVFRSLGTYRFGQLFRSIVVVTGGNAILPLRLGEVMRIGYLVRVGEVSAGSCLGAVALERLLDLCCIVALFVVVMPLTMVDLPAEASFWVFGAVLAIGLVGALLAGRHPDALVGFVQGLGRFGGQGVADKLAGMVGLLAQGLASLRTGRGVILVILWTLAYWAAEVFTVALWIWAFGLTLPWYTPFLVLFFSALGTFLPSSPSAVGTYHFFTTQALMLVGVGRVVATSVVVVGHALAFFPIALISIPWLVIEVVALLGARRSEVSS